jgi:hypothetical protein
MAFDSNGKMQIVGYYHNYIGYLHPIGSFYSSLLGGTSQDQVNGVAVDGTGIYMVGTTYSGSTFYTNRTNVGPVDGSSGDVFLVKMDLTCSRVIFSMRIGSSSIDSGNDIALDSSGNIYICGQTYAGDFPTTSNAYSRTFTGYYDAFMMKFNPTGALLYSTYLGGYYNDIALALTVDYSGRVYLTGSTASSDFPTFGATSNGQVNLGGGAGFTDAFITIIQPGNGSSDLVYSTYLGGTINDVGNDIAIDALNNIYVTGSSYSTDFPTLNAYQGSQRSQNTGYDDAFFVKLNTSTGMSYGSYLGSSLFDEGYSIAVDSLGCAYVTGHASNQYGLAQLFPLTEGAIEFGSASYDSAFITKFDPSRSGASSLIFSTFVGGTTGSSHSRSVKLDGQGNVVILGDTTSSDLPVTSDAFQSVPSSGDVSGYSNAFVMELDPTGTALKYCSYFGGMNSVSPSGMAITSGGNIIGVGYIQSSTYPYRFPTPAGAYSRTIKGSWEGFVFNIHPTLQYSLTVNNPISSQLAGDTEPRLPV